MIGHKKNLNKFKKTEIISSIFYNHDTMRLKINYKKKTARNTNMWRLNNMLPSNQWITKEIKEEIKRIPDTNENEKQIIQNLWDAAKAVLKRKFIAIQAHLRKQEKSQINNLTVYLKPNPKQRKQNKQNSKLVEGKKS